VDDQIANLIVAQLLSLESADREGTVWILIQLDGGLLV